ncbi:heavy metal transport/detoxification protein [Rufibacter sp. LB8]|uniref:heavy metal transport/detoxification protein n=1 Tax=Rufibacter sp. LB8 TaxID=2777781 RepID=UPI00351C016B
MRFMYCQSDAFSHEAIGEGSWRVDTQSPKKILSVTSDKLSEEEVIKAVEKSGYKAEKLS